MCVCVLLNLLEKNKQTRPRLKLLYISFPYTTYSKLLFVSEAATGPVVAVVVIILILIVVVAAFVVARSQGILCFAGE